MMAADMSELHRLVKLLHDNGFEVRDYTAYGHYEQLSHIEVTVYPQKTEKAKDEGAQGND